MGARISQTYQSAENGCWIECIGQPIACQVAITRPSQSVQEVLVLIGCEKGGLGVGDGKQRCPGHKIQDTGEYVG